jgi:glucokinase
VIVDAWFGFQPRELLDEYLEMAGITETLELWCHAPPDTIVSRYAARLGERLPGHPGESYLPELGELAARASPLERGPLHRIDTTQPTNVGAVSDWINANWAD